MYCSFMLRFCDFVLLLFQGGAGVPTICSGRKPPGHGEAGGSGRATAEAEAEAAAGAAAAAVGEGEFRL